MSCLKAVNKKYSDISDVSNLIYYITNPQKCHSGCIGAQGVGNRSLYEILKQMMKTKQNYNQTQGRLVLHYVVSFSNEEMQIINPIDALHIGYEIAANLFPGHQVIFGVHEDTDNLHIHFVVNSTNYYTGQQFSAGRRDFELMRTMAFAIINEKIAMLQRSVS